MTPADELRTAATKLRPSSPAVAAHTEWVKIRPAVADALAILLEGVMSDARESDHEQCQSWCAPETCSLSAALAVARQINGEQP